MAEQNIPMYGVVKINMQDSVVDGKQGVVEQSPPDDDETGMYMHLVSVNGIRYGIPREYLTYVGAAEPVGEPSVAAEEDATYHEDEDGNMVEADIRAVEEA